MLALRKDVVMGNMIPKLPIPTLDKNDVLIPTFVMTNDSQLSFCTLPIAIYSVMYSSHTLYQSVNYSVSVSK